FFGEQLCDPVGVVLVVAQRRIARFEIADRLRVLQELQTPLHSFEACRIKSTALRHVVLAAGFVCPVIAGKARPAIWGRAWPEALASERPQVATAHPGS